LVFRREWSEAEESASNNLSANGEEVKLRGELRPRNFDIA